LNTDIGARVGGNFAAAGFNGDQAAGFNAQFQQVFRMNRDHRIRLDRIQNRCMPGHTAGMPMLKLTAGNKD